MSMSHWPPFNFSAGPALLPASVMEQAKEEFCDWHGSGLSVMDFSHRGLDFTSIAEQAEQTLRALLTISDDYHVLFCHGGASLQFSALAMNLLKRKAVYVNTGIWGKKASQEALKYGNVSTIDALQNEQDLSCILPEGSWAIEGDDFDYLHFTPNETIGGIEFDSVPTVGRGKLVADMSSCILSQPINIKDYGLIYAGAQKNIGPAGLAIVIVRKDWLRDDLPSYVPSLLDYRLLAENQSMYNTPPTFAWYLSGLVFNWIKEQGGVATMSDRATARSQALYQCIDNSALYRNPIHPRNRSRMNVPFILQDEALNSEFLKQAETHGLMYLKGHRSVGGMRASLYNAMPMAGVTALVDFMQWFEQTHG